MAWAANEVMPCGAKKESSIVLEENPLLILPFYIIIIVLINCINFLSYYQIIYTYNSVYSMYTFFK